MKKNLFLHIFCIALFCLLAASCTEKEEAVIKIGLAGVMTGPEGGELGTKALNGALLAVDEQNTKGGLLGKKILAIMRDDEGKPSQAVAVANDLVHQGVVGVIGHINSGCSIPASSVYSQAKVIQISPTSTNPQLTDQGFPTLFRICGRDDQQGPVCAEFAWNKLQVKNVAVLHNKSAGGQGQAEEFKKKFESLGGKVTLFEGISGEEMDFRSIVTSLKASGAQAIFWGGLYSQGGPLFNQMRQAECPIPFLSSDGCFDQNFLNAIGNQGENVYISFGPDYKNIPESQDFLKKYRERFGEEGSYSIYGYEAARILIQALEEAGTTDAQEVAEILKNKTFQTSLGPLSFDQKGDLKSANFIIWTVRGNQFVPHP